MIKLIGFAPDADPTTPGVLTACTNLIPNPAGYSGAPAPVSVGAATLAAACRGAASVTDLTGTRKLYAGTSAALYELSAATWTDRSRAGAPAYALGADDRWSFAQYANATLAATITADLQRCTTGAYADVATPPPKAKIVECAQGFAVVFNTANFTDEWWCSTYLDETVWTLSAANQCVKGRLVSAPGPITAAKRFGDQIIVYKDRAMFSGSYVGAPEVWRFAQVSTDVGCIGQDAVVDTSIGHVFCGRDSLYVYDGTTPRPLGVGVIRDALFADMAGSYQSRTQLLWDKTNLLVWIYYASGGGTGTVDRCVVYDVVTQRFGRANSTIEAVVTYITPALTYAGNATITTYAAGPVVSYDSQFWLSGAATPAVFTGSHILSTLSGPCATASLTTGDMGTEDGYSFCRNFKVRYSTAPTTSTATGYTKDESGATVATGSSATQSDGKHDMRQTARWHRFTVATTGDFTVSGVMPAFSPAGRR